MAGLCRGAVLTPWYNPTTGGGANASEPLTVDHLGWDVYATKDQSGGVTAEPKMLANDEADYWGMNSLLTWKPHLRQAVFEFGVGEDGDDPVFMAGALDLFAKAGVDVLCYWDSDDSYSGQISDGSKPGQALEFLKRFGPSAVAYYLDSATLYSGPMTVSTPGVPHILAELPNGHQALLLWAPGESKVTTEVTFSALRTMTGVHSDGSRKAFGRAGSLTYTCVPGSLGVVDLQG